MSAPPVPNIKGGHASARTGDTAQYVGANTNALTYNKGLGALEVGAIALVTGFIVYWVTKK